MKKAGFIGGIAPASTIDYYKGIIDGCRAYPEFEGYPEIIIDSINLSAMLRLVAENRWEELIHMLLHAIENLRKGGADFAAILANTPHIVFDEVEKRSVLPLISIVKATCQAAQKQGSKKVVVLGTIFTMRSGLYTKAFKDYGIEAFVPDDQTKLSVNNIIYPNLENGIVMPQQKSEMLDIANTLIAENNADALVLGCTELPLMIKQEDIKTPILNTTQIHTDAIVKYLME